MADLDVKTGGGFESSLALWVCAERVEFAQTTPLLDDSKIMSTVTRCCCFERVLLGVVAQIS